MEKTYSVVELCERNYHIIAKVVNKKWRLDNHFDRDEAISYLHEQLFKIASRFDCSKTTENMQEAFFYQTLTNAFIDFTRSNIHKQTLREVTLHAANVNLAEKLAKETVIEHTHGNYDLYYELLSVCEKEIDKKIVNVATFSDDMYTKVGDGQRFLGVDRISNILNKHPHVIKKRIQIIVERYINKFGKEHCNSQLQYTPNLFR